MAKKVVFSQKNGIGFCSNDGSVRTLPSSFIENYKKNAEQIARSNEWKQSGFGAQFTQSTPIEVPPDKYESAINGICLVDNTLYYSAQIQSSSGILSKNTDNEKLPEGHIIHDNNAEYGDIDVSLDGKTLVSSIKNDAFSSNIALFSLVDGGYISVTGGDSKDTNPSFSLKNGSKILYSSAGIGRNFDGDFVKYAPSIICSYDIDTREVKDEVFDEKHSLILPKEDNEGNLYYIERPAKEKLKKPNLFLEILLIPFRLIYAIYKFLEAFVKIFTGKGFTTKTEGDNPGKQKSERDIIVDGYKVQARENLQKSEKRKEKFPGYAPSDWVLKRKNLDGTITEIQKGVISYDLDENSIVYTNGKSVIRLFSDGKSEKIADADFCSRVSVEKTINKDAVLSSSPFDL